VTHIYQILRH